LDEVQIHLKLAKYQLSQDSKSIKHQPEHSKSEFTFGIKAAVHYLNDKKTEIQFGLR
jgi:hypothetical protein